MLCSALVSADKYKLVSQILKTEIIQTAPEAHEMHSGAAFDVIHFSLKILKSVVIAITDMTISVIH